MAMKPNTEKVEVEYDPHQPVVEAIQAGDAHAMAEFVHAQGRWVRGVVFGILGRAADVEDVCQRVWIKVWRECRTLSDTSRWRPWLYQITRRAAIDELRAGRRRQRQTAASLDGAELAGVVPAAPVAGPDRQVMLKEEHEAVLAAIANLPPLYREPFVLKHVDGWSYAQIGEVLGLPTDTVETRLVRARRLLRGALAG